MSRLQDVLQKVKQGVQFCEVCGNVAAARRCRYCSDARRDPTIVCVVEEPKDVLAVERTREFKGRYHVLGGALDPLAGVGPDSLRIRELLTRLGGTGPAADETDITEVIIATDPNTEGEATATYLVRLLRDFPGLSVTRPASGSADGWRPRVRRRADAGSRPLRPPGVVRPARRPGARGVDQMPGNRSRPAPRRSARLRCSQSARRSRAISRQVPAWVASTMPTTVARTISPTRPMARTAITVTTPVCRIGYR